ncbi:Tryptophan--tRNA ligase [compost metagenome]
MSKSNPNLSSYVLLLDSPEMIQKKFARAVTDSEGCVYYNWETKPAISNLIEIYSVFSDESIDNVVKKFDGQGYGIFKKELAELVVEKLVPIQNQFKDIVNSVQLDEILQNGAEQASIQANNSLAKAKQAMGLVTF